MLHGRLCSLALAALLVVVSALPGFAESIPASRSIQTIRTAWLAEYEAFAAWYAHEQKWDEENGIRLEFEVFPTGKNLMDNMRNAGCVIGGGGGVAVVAGLLERDVTIIAMGADETEANALYVRPNSPLLTRKGENPQYPNVFGSAALLSGKTLVTPLGTSAHQLLHTWLGRLGVDEAAVTTLDAKPEEALAAFVGGMGDVVALWAPYTAAAESQGLRRVATGKDCGIVQPAFIVAEYDFTEQYPEQTVAFLKAYLRAADALAMTPLDELVPLYQRFMVAFGHPLDADAARVDLTTHCFFTAKEQRAFFQNRTAGGEGNLWLEDVIRFHQATGALSRRQLGELERMPRLTSRFLDAAMH